MLILRYATHCQHVAYEHMIQSLRGLTRSLRGVRARGAVVGIVSWRSVSQPLVQRFPNGGSAPRGRRFWSFWGGGCFYGKHLF
jgi:hypothetical protein